jgi:hypothetical protein
MEVVAYTMKHYVKKIIMQLHVLLTAARAEFIIYHSATIQTIFIRAVMLFHKGLNLTKP